MPITCQLPLAADSRIADRSIELSLPRSSQTEVTLAYNTAISLSKVERGIVAEMNRARANPPAYRQVLISWRRRFRGKQVQLKPRLFLQTQEGTRAIDEAILALKKTRPVPILKFSRGLTLAARDHVRDQGNRGITGHNGADGST